MLKAFSLSKFSLRNSNPALHYQHLKRSIASLNITEEIKDALANGKPVVALESTIITHGMPFPDNLSMASTVEQEIRNKGAIPATIAFINGNPNIGLTNQQLEILASSKNVNKISRRDIAYTMANKLSGGTTIAGTMILAEKAGIKVFATGGLGGVTKNHHFDVSADLIELGRTKVAVVCAGPKSILDVANTLEVLETQGCFVGTLSSKDTNIPGFFTKDSGVKSPYSFRDFKEAAEIIYNGNNLMDLKSGYLFCIPPPDYVALDPKMINDVISMAETEAENQGIGGKHLTPFLLKRIAELSKGKSVSSNIQFVLNNARAAAEISKNLSYLES
ncbi:pseudouridine-5'-phosphate glycosidase, partial [Ascoidea rubescens DSM 1968]